MKQLTPEQIESLTDSFWSNIAGMFPEVSTGDLDPFSAHKLEQALQEAGNAWLDCNHPDNLEQE